MAPRLKRADGTDSQRNASKRRKVRSRQWLLLQLWPAWHHHVPAATRLPCRVRRPIPCTADGSDAVQGKKVEERAVYENVLVRKAAHPRSPSPSRTQDIAFCLSSLNPTPLVSPFSRIEMHCTRTYHSQRASKASRGGEKYLPFGAWRVNGRSQRALRPPQCRIGRRGAERDLQNSKRQATGALKQLLREKRKERWENGNKKARASPLAPGLPSGPRSVQKWPVKQRAPWSPCRVADQKNQT